MAETKYGKYIITETPRNPAHPDIFGIWINNELNKTMKGAFYLQCNLVLNKDEKGPDCKPHNDDFEEYLIFLGTNPEDPSDLGGEVELWLGENEKQIISKSAAVFIPRGLYHTPLLFNRVDRPIVMVRTGNSLKDHHLSYSQAPRWAHLPDIPEGLPPIG